MRIASAMPVVVSTARTDSVPSFESSNVTSMGTSARLMTLSSLSTTSPSFVHSSANSLSPW
jgi:hypothetical protein